MSASVLLIGEVDEDRTSRANVDRSHSHNASFSLSASIAKSRSWDSIFRTHSTSNIGGEYGPRFPRNERHRCDANHLAYRASRTCRQIVSRAECANGLIGADCTNSPVSGQEPPVFWNRPLDHWIEGAAELPPSTLHSADPVCPGASGHNKSPSVSGRALASILTSDPDL